MNNRQIPIYLASKSPRRKKLLQQINLNFKTLSVDIPENYMENESPVKVVKRIALEKLEAAKKKINEGIIITADTIVVLNKKIIGKPGNAEEAFNILKRLSGKTHQVYTGFTIYSYKKNLTLIDYEKTFVTFRKLSDNEMKDYIKTGSPMDKAGAYGIQDDFGAVFVEKINGCYYNVVGLPLSKLYKTLQKAF